MSRDRVLTKIILLIGILYFTICGLGKPQAVTLRYWNVGSAYDAIMYRKIAADFEKETGIKVIVQPISWGQFYTKYLTAMAAGDPPDLATTNMGGPGDYGSVGGLIDFQSEFPNEVAQLQEMIYKGQWRVFYFQNHLYGIPHGMTSLAIFYRKDIFQKLGIEPPTTWAELEKVIRVLEANDYQFTFGFTRDSGWAIGQFTIPLGAEPYSKDGTGVNWLDPRFVEGYKWAARLWNMHNMALDKAVELFVTDEKGIASPMMIDGLWYYTEIEKRSPELKGKWGIVPMPAANNGNRMAILGGTAYIIFRQSKHRQEAMQWIMYNYRKEVQQFIFDDNLYNRGEGRGLYFSPLKSFWDDRHEVLPKEDQIAITQILDAGQSWPYIVSTPETGRFLDDSLSRIRNATRDFATQIASSKNLSRWDLHKSFAQGKYPEDYKKYLNFVNDYCEKELERITPQANKTLAKGREDFNKYYANIVDRLPALEKKKDILDYAKNISLLIIICCVLMVVIPPSVRKHWVSYLYISPSILLLLIFLFIPMIVSVYIAFTAYNPVLPLSTADWIGLSNFKEVLFAKFQIFSDPVNANLSIFAKIKMFFTENSLWSSLGRTFKFTAIVIPFQLIIAVLLAVGLNKELRPDRIYKFVYFSPLVTSIVSIALIWSVLFLGAKYGWINALLLNLDIIRDPIDFIHDSKSFLNAVITMSIWHGLAFVILIYLAGLQNIPNEHYEAASIDGANGIQQFWQITIPALRPQILFLTVTGTIGALQVFEQIYILGGGAGEAGSKFGPADSGLTMVCYIYRKGFEEFKMGEASAIAYVLFAIIFMLTYINWKWLLGRQRD